MTFEGEPKFEKPTDKQKPVEKEERMEEGKGEEPVDKERIEWEKKKEEDLRKLAEEKYRKRLEGKEPGYTWKEVDEMLREKGIVPGSPEARDFMEKWDWEHAEEEWRKEREEKWKESLGTIGRKKDKEAGEELIKEKEAKEKAKAETTQSPEGKPEKGKEKRTSEYDTTMPERELRRDLKLHEQIFARMQDLIREGEKAMKRLGIGEKELQEYLPLLPRESIKGIYSDDLKKIQAKMEVDANRYVSEFLETFTPKARTELSSAIRERINNLGEAKNIEAFYTNITDKNGRIKIEALRTVMSGEIAKIIAEREKEAKEKIRETLRRQFALTEEYSVYRKRRERVAQEYGILRSVLSKREIEAISSEGKIARSLELDLKEQLPEEVTKKKTKSLMKWINGRKLRLKKVLRERLI